MKNKNNIIIICAVTFTVLAVIAVVLFTGFANSGRGTESSEPSGHVSAVWDESSAIENSEPESEPYSEPRRESSEASADDVGQRIASSAVSLIGIPFVENGASPDGFDNSGFIYYVLRENGFITCPRTTDAQSKMGAVIGSDELKAGDLVFFGNDGSGQADIGGIYIGEGKMVACQMPGTNVREVDITTDYYVENFYGGISMS